MLLKCDLFVSVAHMSGLPVSESVYGVENRLIQQLMVNYSRFGRPIADISNPVQVSISFYLTQLMSLVSVNAVFLLWIGTQDEIILLMLTVYRII